MEIEPGIEEAASMPDVIVSVATHNHGGIAEDTFFNETAAAQINAQRPIMDIRASLSMPTSTPFPMNHEDGDSAASHAGTLKNTPQSASATDESSFVDMASATDSLPTNQTQLNENASVQNTEDLGTDSSSPPPDGKGDSLPSRASRSKKTTKMKRKPKPSNPRKKARRRKDKQEKQEGQEERQEHFRALRKELADDGPTVQESVDDQLEDLTDELNILEGEMSKLNRILKKRPLNKDELQKREELRENSTKVRKEIQDLEMSKRSESAPKNTLSKTAREFWARKHAAGPKEIWKMANKITGNKRKRGKDNDEDDPVAKKHKGGSNADVQDSRQALAKALGIQDQQEISLENKTKLFQQLSSKKTRGPGTDPGARDQLQVLKHATSSFGQRGCSLQRERSDNSLNLFRWKISSFKSLLYNHQVVGVSWMLGREFSPQPPYGGILGDTMGLGKTVQILACMAHNPPLLEEYPDGHPYKTKATLIIAPASALNQWKNEILIHTCFKPAYIYKRSGSRVADKSLWMTTDIV